MTDRKPEVTAEHRETALEVWRRSNDPAAGDDFGPELVAEALAAAEQRGLDLGRAESERAAIAWTEVVKWAAGLSDHAERTAPEIRRALAGIEEYVSALPAPPKVTP